MRTPRPLLLAAALLALLPAAACEGGEGADPAAAGDTLTRDQRDSVVGESSLPGAGGVQGARRARDLANERTERHDTTSPREE